ADADAHVGEGEHQEGGQGDDPDQVVGVEAASLDGRDQVAGAELPGTDDEGRTHHGEVAHERAATGASSGSRRGFGAGGFGIRWGRRGDTLSGGGTAFGSGGRDWWRGS